jgi:hypothetical protein
MWGHECKKTDRSRCRLAADGLGLNALMGEALFVGPAFYVSLSKHFAVSGSWTTQVAGHATGVTGALDLQNFERHQAKLRLIYTF